MKTLIKRYPCTAFYTLIASLQLIIFWLAILVNTIAPPHIANVVLAAALVGLGFEVDTLRLDRKKNTREN